MKNAHLSRFESDVHRHRIGASVEDGKREFFVGLVEFVSR